MEIKKTFNDVCVSIRAQGQTWRDQLVSVDLGLGSPDDRVPDDISSLLYVACSRVTNFEFLFVAPIFMSTWDSIGKSKFDINRRQIEDEIR